MCAIGLSMQQPGQNLLARAALALHENGYRRIRDTIKLFASSSHHCGTPEDHIHRRQIVNIH